ncbi:MAG: Uma2 family endonuclease [Leptolyngbya sp. IPPAS B-1204]|nr:MAG: Uma2 family endonuclease [Leptolyngbya sp. IPPAS B-1204]
MTAITSSANTLIYPSSDGEPVAETFDHLYAILTILEVLRQYLQDQRATVLANQFLYYAQGFPKLRVAPDVMVIFDVEPGGRDNYKIWEEGQVPKVIFEITSASTRQEDTGHKQVLYEQLEVDEYWLFDPKGDWIDGQLLGYRLQEGRYLRIADQCSQALNLRLQVEGKLLGFYRLDTGEKLLLPDELAQALRQESTARQAAEQRAEFAEQRAESAEQQLAQERQQREALLQRLQERGINLEDLNL